ncbi:MAG TPA: TetR/AcrR family transcriptional regulator [Actinophytocola sp.]|uniref:TetR/AcrR family transcriptional regulator n=1 Tax=Actinophytocola sp. TaxID=1872138 RepID=UPI002DDDA426|nr:TetR/AcrR family transcriptional regulator [Actinophytocola sp.]HEV2779324.1 TetR/AcrR family transcriptional regulator [Actinophytocola sp.]
MADKTTTPPAAGSIRARVRAEMIDQIKTIARRHIEAEGANLSLRAVARDLGVVSSALYRYFANRDDLLTALIIDAYDSLGDAAERADAAVPDRSDVLARWLAVAHALRTWSVDRPHEYALIYGSPVPGYAAPRDTVEPSTRPVMVLGAILADAKAARRLSNENATPIPTALRLEILRVAETIGAKVTAPIMARAMIAWTQLFGAISFEVFGRLNNTIDHRTDWYDYQARTMATFIGLT